MLTGKRIGVLMGGASAEREVSLRSGGAVYNALRGRGYDAVSIDAGRDVALLLIDEKIEIAFLVLHGGSGEDGSIQGLLEVMGIPYTGSGVLASALAMDKEASKKIFIYHGLRVPEFRTIKKGGHYETPGISFPVVVKPAHEGSSIGVSIVKEEGRLKEALNAAFALDDRVLMERYIEGKEVHIGILGGRALGGVEVRPSLEFYSYEAKYTSGLTEYILPPQISDDSYLRAKEAAVSAHAALGCRGATRVDLIVDKNGDPYLLEINTIPGMTETSLLPKIAGFAGLDFPSLVEEILKEALADD
jgi:D-alanine-D-alanine ligase